MTRAHPSTVRGMDHVGITVPDLEAASRFLMDAFGAVPLYDNIARGEAPTAGSRAEAMLLLAPGTTLVTMRMLALGSGPGIELFEMHGPDQAPAARPSDFGLQHVAVNVDDLDAACARFEAAGGTLAAGPNAMLGLEEGPGNGFRYGRTPWGAVVEMLTTPGRQDYEDRTALRRWKPPSGVDPGNHAGT